MTYICSMRTISFKIVVLYREKIEMKIFHFFVLLHPARRA
ncbi:hypothetical protein CSC03_3261 [Enterobacter hormaechei]|nr:hypothetical protein CSC03_3261 [Enterobacter hormaechei]